MRVAELQSGPWTMPATAQSVEFDSNNGVSLSAGLTDRILADEVARVRPLLNACRAASESVIRLYETHRDDPRISDIESGNDDQLLDGIKSAGLMAERIRARLEPLSRYLSRLRRLRDSQIVWSPDAEALLENLQELSDVLTWADTTAQEWCRQCSDAYERRHADNSDLPFTPIDLGPTNAARLPHVL